MSVLPPGLERGRPAVEIPDDPSPLRQPPRLAVILGSVAMVAACLMPWAVGLKGATPVQHSVFEGTIDGAYISLVAVLLLARALTRLFDDTESRTLQLLPLALVGVAAVTWTSGHMAALRSIESWEDAFGAGRLTEAPIVALAGIVLAGLGTGWLEWRREPDVRRATPSLVSEWGVSGRSLVVGGFAATGGILGAVGSLAIGNALLGWPGMFLTMGLTVLGGYLATHAGMAVAGRLLRR